MIDALWITVIGMLAVYMFLFMLMCAVKIMSACLLHQQKNNQNSAQIAALIGIALQGRKGNGCS